VQGEWRFNRGRGCTGGRRESDRRSCGGARGCSFRVGVRYRRARRCEARSGRCSRRVGFVDVEVVLVDVVVVLVVLVVVVASRATPHGLNNSAAPDPAEPVPATVVHAPPGEAAGHS